MRKLLLGAGAIGVFVAGAVALGAWHRRGLDPDRLLAACQVNPLTAGLQVRYPFDEALFPPESIAPVFRWDDTSGEASRWLIAFEFPDGQERLFFWSDTLAWTVPPEAWEEIKLRSRAGKARAVILGVQPGWRHRVVSAGSISFATSDDEVGSPIFYREVNLPFADAVKDPSQIRWRFGAVSSREQPPVVLEKLPVCGNCHSFSSDGKVLGMDVDYGSDKGSYAIVPVSKEMTLSRDRIITWNDYKREDRRTTQGLLAQVSPDGRYVIGTVKDESVFLPVDNLPFSQLFFPIKGILAVYDREADTFQALPGADDPVFVQSNPVWSPDGKWILFAKSKAHAMRRGPGEKTTRLTLADVEELLKRRKTFLFDLYRIPFNGGKGGAPQPVPGASSNGMSNYFPKFSPDGKWIVFCQANSFMLLQPDSTLYILPAEGGEPRRLACNTGRMNSWHSWSPNGKWLVFSSKAFTPYTQLFLTHIDERGQSTRPVLLEQFTSADRAANIPEFVNAPPEGIEKIRERFLDDDSYSTVAMANVRAGQLEQGEKAARKALAMNPKNPRALGYLGAVFVARKDYHEAERCFRESLGYEPTSPFVHFNLGKLLFLRGLNEQGLAEMRAGVKMDPDLYDGRFALGTALLRASRFAEAEEHFTEAARIWPTNVNAQCGLGEALRAQGKDEAALAHFTAALKQDANCAAGMMGIARIYAESSQPGLRNPAAAVQMAERAGQSDPGQRPRALTVVAAVSAGAGAYAEAVRFAEEALRLATAKGQAELAAEVRGQLDRYRAKAK